MTTVTNESAGNQYTYLNPIIVPILPNPSVEKITYLESSAGSHKYGDLFVFFKSKILLETFSPEKVGGLKELGPTCFKVYCLHKDIFNKVGKLKISENMLRIRFWDQRASPHKSMGKAVKLIANHYKKNKVMKSEIH